MERHSFTGSRPAQWGLRIAEFPAAGFFAFIILERCNLGGTAPVFIWMTGHRELFLIEIAALVCVYGLVRAFFRLPFIPFAIYGGAVNLIGTANFYKLYYRSEPIIPFDIFNMTPAFTIANRMGLVFNLGLIFNLVFFMICLLLVFLIQKRLYKKNAARRIWTGLPVFCVSALCLIYMTSIPRLTAAGAVDIRYDQYNNYMVNGFTVATLMNFTDNRVKAPHNYSAAAIGGLRETIRGAEEPAASGYPPKQPHIIVLQMEAYGDPGFIDPRVCYEEDPFGPLAPYAAEMRRFRALTSVLGGGTANTEYEFLTGYNMYFCPPGVIPFIHYMNSPKPSLATDLSALGYQTIVMHPHAGSFYNRAAAYARMGFDRFITQEEFDDPVYIGYYISDGSFGRKVIEIFEEEKGREPLFLYGISIQNHGPYNSLEHRRDYPLTLKDGLILNETQRMELETYGANIRDASVMLANLIRYLSMEEDPVLLLVYGDHQAAWSWVHELPACADLDMRRYSSEGFFWANYPLEDDERPLISVSGLGPLLMLRAALPLSPYQKGINLQFNELLAYNVAIAEENDGTVNYIRPERVDGYRLLQYDRMFGKNYLGQPD